MDLKKFSVYDQPAESKTVLDSYTQDLQSLNAKITDLLSLNESFEKLRTDLSQYASREDLKLAIVALLEKIDPIQKNLDASLSREVSTLKENIRSLATRTADLDRLVNAEALERNRQLQRSLTEQDNKLHDLLQIVETTSSEQIPDLTAQVQQLAEQVELQNQVDLNPLQEAIDAVKQQTNIAIAGLKVQADDVQHDLNALITEHNTNNELIGVLTDKVDELDSAVGAYDQALTEHREIITEQLNRKLAVIETDVEQLDGDLQAQNNRLTDFEFSLRGEVTDVMQGLRKTLTILESSVGAEQASIRDLVQNNSLALKDLIQEHYNKLNKRITEAALTDVPVLTESTVADPGAKTKDPLTPLNQNFVTFDQLKQHYQLFVNRVQQQLVSLGGGGAVRLQDLDDVDFFSFRDSSVNGWPLVYKSATNKWTSSNVMSDATFTGNVAVQGFLTVNSDALFEQNVLIQKNLTVEGNITVRGQTSYIQTETLTVDDNIILLNSNVTAAPSENAGIEIERGSANNVLVRWNEGTDRWETTVDGTNYIELANQGLDTNDSPTFVDLNLTGNANILGNVFIGGNLILGNQDTDTVSIGADLISNVIPDASNTYYLGLSTKTWRELHAHHLNINNVLSPQGHTNVLNSINVTGTVSLTSVGTGDVAANVGNINSWLRTTNSNVGNLNSWVSSNSGNIGNLNSWVSSNSSNIGNLNSWVSSNSSNIGNLNAWASSNSSNIGNLNSWVSSNSSNIGNLNAWASSNSSNIGNLNSWIGNNIDQPVKSISTPTFNGIKVTDTVYPLSDQAYDLGKADLRFKDLWLSGTTIHLGNANLTAAANGSVTVDNNFTTTGNLIVMGNLFAYGNAVQFDTNTLVINDPLIQVGKTPIGDVVDLGFFGHYVGGAPSIERHAGLFRDASDGQFKLFTNLDPEPVNTVDTANASYQSANLVLNHVIGELHDFTAKVRGNVSGGTGVAYNSSNGQISIGQPVWTNNSVTFANVTLTDYVNLSTRGLRFPADAYGGGSDTATITLETAGGEATRMTFTMTNDADDVFNFIAPSNDGLLMNSNKVWHAGNDGAGSGLDADLLDNNNSSFYTLTTNHTEGTNLFFTNTRVQNYLTGSVGNIVPSQNNYYDLGSTAYRWKDLYLSGNTLILGGASLSSTGAALTLPAGSSIAGTQIATTANLNTSNVTEGTNLYFSNARVANAFIANPGNTILFTNASNVVTSSLNLIFDGTNLGFGLTPRAKLDLGSSANLRLNSYTYLGRRNNNSDFIGFNALGTDGSAYITPGFAGAAYASMSIITMNTGGVGGTLEFRTYQHGTNSSPVLYTDIPNRLSIGPSELVINEDSTAYNFRVESDGDANMLLVDASANRIGLRMNAPLGTVHLSTEGTGRGIVIDNTYTGGAGGSSGLSAFNVKNHLLELRAAFGDNPESVGNNGMKWGIKFTGSTSSTFALDAKGAGIYAVSEEMAGAGYNRMVGLAFEVSAFDASPTERFRINSTGTLVSGHNAGYAYSSDAGSIVLSNGAIDTPNLQFATGNNKNWGIDSWNSAGAGGTQATQYLRLVKDINETGGVTAVVISPGGAIGLGGSYDNTGVGIKFPATQSASSDANTLDDYEEGTWTPAVRGSGTAGTYQLSIAEGAYVKIGRQVTLTCRVLFSTITGGGTGYLQITGAPSFNNSYISTGSVFHNGLNLSAGYTWLSVAHISTSGTNILYFPESGDEVTSNDFPISGVSSGDIFYFSITYLTST